MQSLALHRSGLQSHTVPHQRMLAFCLYCSHCLSKRQAHINTASKTSMVLFLWTLLCTDLCVHHPNSSPAWHPKEYRVLTKGICNRPPKRQTRGVDTISLSSVTQILLKTLEKSKGIKSDKHRQETPQMFFSSQWDEPKDIHTGTRLSIEQLFTNSETCVSQLLTHSHALHGAILATSFWGSLSEEV